MKGYDIRVKGQGLVNGDLRSCELKGEEYTRKGAIFTSDI